jgi:hypothetical protein
VQQHLEPLAATPPVEAEKDESTLWPEARIPSFAGYAGDSDYPETTEELDIPAFLRRKH